MSQLYVWKLLIPLGFLAICVLVSLPTRNWWRWQSFMAGHPLHSHMGLWNLCTLDPSNNEAQCFGVDIGCTFDQGKVQLANCDLLLATRGLSLLTASLVLLTALCVLLELCTDVVHVFYSTIVRACLSFAAPSAMGAVITGALFRKRSEEVQHDSTWSFGISYYSWATAVALCFCCLVIALATKPPPTTAAQRSSARSSYLAVQ